MMFGVFLRRLVCGVRCLPCDCLRSLDCDFRYFRLVVPGLWRVTFVAFLLTLLNLWLWRPVFGFLMSRIWVSQAWTLYPNFLCISCGSFWLII